MEHPGVDFSSNDYLGFAKSKDIHLNNIEKIQGNFGATGSRLLTGNNKLYQDTEKIIADFLHTPKALIYPSGYMANVGLLSAVLQRNDVVLFDELSHASIKDGIRLNFAKAYPFKHNDVADLRKKLQKINKETTVYVVTESVFSMDGDIAPLKEISSVLNENHYLIVDETHAVGVIGKKGEGLVSFLELDNEVFAKVVTFGKALGVHGAAVLGSKELIDYLVNFSRPFIYTTGLSAHTLIAIQNAFNKIFKHPELINDLNRVISYYLHSVEQSKFKPLFSVNKTAIQYIKVSGNSRAKNVANHLISCGFDVRPILSPTVKKGEERLRICLHRYNTKDEIQKLISKTEEYLQYEQS